MLNLIIVYFWYYYDYLQFGFSIYILAFNFIDLFNFLLFNFNQYILLA